MNQYTIEEIRDRIAQFKVEGHYEPGQILKLLEILDALALRVRLIELQRDREPNHRRP